MVLWLIVAFFQSQVKHSTEIFVKNENSSPLATKADLAAQLR